MSGGCFAPRCDDVLHVSRRRPTAQDSKQAIESAATSLSMDFDRSVVMVPYHAREAECFGFLLNEPAESNALNAPFHFDVHVVCHSAFRIGSGPGRVKDSAQKSKPPLESGGSTNGRGERI